jgi:hypothetical protein
MKTESSLRLPFFNLPVLICFALFWTLAICAYASTITVTTTNDSGPGSLRQALVDANDGNTITFAVTGTSGELVLDNSVTINGRIGFARGIAIFRHLPHFPRHVGPDRYHSRSYD